ATCGARSSASATTAGCAPASPIPTTSASVILITAAPAPAAQIQVWRLAWIPKSRVERFRGGRRASAPGARGGSAVRLALSTAAATEFTMDELLAACRRRGLAGIELVAGHAHGVDTAVDPAELGAVRQRLEAGGAPVVAFRTTPAGAFHPNAARLSAVLGAPVVVSPEGENGIPADALLSAAPAYEAEGAMLLVAHGSEPDDVGRLRRVIEHAPAGALGLA